MLKRVSPFAPECAQLPRSEVERDIILEAKRKGPHRARGFDRKVSVRAGVIIPEAKLRGTSPHAGI